MIRVRHGTVAAIVALAAALSGCMADDGYYGDPYPRGGGYYGDGRGYYGDDSYYRGRRVVYRCAERRSFAADFSRDGDRVVLDLGRRSVEMRLVGRDDKEFVYAGERRDRDFRFVARRDGQAFLQIEDAEDFRSCRTYA